jgi:hypothetical protein
MLPTWSSGYVGKEVVGACDGRMNATSAVVELGEHVYRNHYDVVVSCFLFMFADERVGDSGW